MSIVVPADARSSPSFGEHLAELEALPRVEIDDDAPALPTPNEFQSTPGQQRRHFHRVARFLSERILDLEAQVVILPTADRLDATLMRQVRNRGRHDVRLVFAYHWVRTPRSLWTRLRVRAPFLDPYELLWRADSFDAVALLLQDHTVLDYLRALRPAAGERVGLIPYPLRRLEPVARSVARAHFELPPDAPIVGVTGSIQERKRIDAFLRRARRSPQLDHIFFAVVGPFQAGVREALQAEFAPMLETGRLILRDRWLSLREVGLALRAFDAVICTYNSNKRGVSAIALEALAIGCPVLGVANPWLRSIRERTGCAFLIADPNDTEQLTAAVLDAMRPGGCASPGSQALSDLNTVKGYRAAMISAVEDRHPMLRGLPAPQLASGSTPGRP